MEPRAPSSLTKPKPETQRGQYIEARKAEKQRAAERRRKEHIRLSRRTPSSADFASSTRSGVYAPTASFSERERSNARSFGPGFGVYTSSSTTGFGQRERGSLLLKYDERYEAQTQSQVSDRMSSMSTGPSPGISLAKHVRMQRAASLQQECIEELEQVRAMRSEVGKSGAKKYPPGVNPGYVQLGDATDAVDGSRLERRKSFSDFRKVFEYAAKPDRKPNCLEISLFHLVKRCLPNSCLAWMLPTAYYS